VSASAPTAEVLDGLAVTRARCPGAPVAVVLVHGAMDRSASFSRVARRLEDVEVLTYDRRGYAGSPAQGSPVGLEGHAADLLAVAATASAPEVVLVGHSYGGLVALRAAELAPLDRVGSWLRAVGSFEAPMPWRTEYGRSTGLDTIELGRREGPGAAAEHFYRAMVGDAVWARLRPGDRAARRADGAALLDDLTSARDASAAADPERHRAAVHSARGELSRARLRWAAEELARQFGTPLTEIAGAGHGAHLTHPGQFAAWVVESLRGTVPT
jgi:pimeloyl-ACP methyl ester carboxylesterase